MSTSRQRPTFSDRLARFKSAWSSRRFLRAVAVASLVVVIDQIAKSLALRTLEDGPILVVGQAGFRLAFNTGAAFSLGTDSTSLLIVIGLAAVVLLLAVSGVVSNRLPATAIALIIGGAAGNVIDRLFRQHDGAVVDFFDLGFWPVFNFADVAIVTGCGLLIWSSFRGEPRDDAT